MHELGLAEGIMTVAMDMAGERTVRRIVVRIGEEQRVVADSLEFGFQLLAEGTICEGATLQCLAVPGVTVLVDEVELDGIPPTILRRPGAEVVEPPHDHAHTGHNGVATAPVVSADVKGGA
jgi:Hydrogenase/urease nickel incorporation, metallochaperone, hypA